MNFKLYVVAALAIVAASPAFARSQSVSSVLNVSPGCYPVTYDESKDQIGVICRGQENWVPEGVQFFSNFMDTETYRNSIGVRSSLRWDMSNGVGPGPWLKYFFTRLDKNGIPRPQ